MWREHHQPDLIHFPSFLHIYKPDECIRSICESRVAHESEGHVWKLKCQNGIELKSWQKRYDTFVETSIKPMAWRMDNSWNYVDFCKSLDYEKSLILAWNWSWFLICERHDPHPRGCSHYMHMINDFVHNMISHMYVPSVEYA